MRINTHAKGLRNQLEYIKILLKKGYVIEFKSFANPYGSVDYANLFDIVARYKNKHRVYVQIKTNHSYSSELIKMLKSYRNNCALPQDKIILADRHDQKIKIVGYEIKHKKDCPYKYLLRNRKNRPSLFQCPGCKRKYKIKKEKISPHWEITEF